MGIKEIKNSYLESSCEEEKEKLHKETLDIINNSPESFLAMMKESSDRATALALKVQLREVLPFLSLSYLAKEYFGKERSWLHQRINNNIVNGKPAIFKPQELDTLEKALQDCSKKLAAIKLTKSG